jgi:glycosyltransferase involved in cell wall biosynthesis
LKKVLLRGPLLSNSGYGVHSRQVFEFLNSRKDIDLKCDITPWGNTSWRLNEYEDKSYKSISKILEKYILSKDVASYKFDESYQVCFPNEWCRISNFDVGITAGIETTICNSNWIHDINVMDKVIVPSNFSKEVFKNSSKYHDINLSTEILVIPEYYHEEFDLDDVLNKFDVSSIVAKKNVLISGQLTSLSSALDRKNIFKTIEIVTRELSSFDDAGLIIKTNLGKNSKKDLALLKKVMNKYHKELKSELGLKTPKIYLIHGDMSPLELKSLYESEKLICFISCTRGEGFGLQFLEAARCGLPIIATNWSAYTEFLDFFLKVDYDLVDIDKSKVDNKLFLKNSKWAEFKEESLKQKLREVLSCNYKKDERCTQQKRKIINKMSKSSIIDIYKQKLDRL